MLLVLFQGFKAHQEEAESDLRFSIITNQQAEISSLQLQLATNQIKLSEGVTGLGSSVGSLVSKISPRSISAEQRRQIISALKAAPNQVFAIEIAIIDGDSEVSVFGRSVIDLFEEAGVRFVNKATPIGVSNGRPFPRGLRLLIPHSGDDPTSTMVSVELADLCQSLKASGLFEIELSRAVSGRTNLVVVYPR